MFNPLFNVVRKKIKVSLSIIVIITLIVTSIISKYNTGYLIGFIILFVLLMLDHIKRIIFDMKVKKIFGIEFGEIEKENIKERIREEVSRREIGLTSTQIDTISDVALNQITGVANKFNYYEELVLYALKDLGVEYQHEFSAAVGMGSFNIDFVIELEGTEVLGIEAAYSDQRFLSRDIIDRIIHAVNTFKKADDLKGFAIVTNAEVRPREKELLSNQDPPIEVLDNVISPDGIISAVQKFIQKFSKQRT